ncbi:MAG: phosphotransferase [Acidimicrobiales bacterium]
MGDRAVTALHAPVGIDEVDERWLTAALASTSGGATAVAVTKTAVGNGNISASVKLGVTWDRECTAPSSFVIKVPTDAEESRAAAAATRTYEVEAGFYTDVADTVRVHRPRCYTSVHDPVTQGYAVLLEDMSPATAGDQLAGCSPDDAAAAIPELVALHAPRWADPSLLDVAWLGRPSDEGAMMVNELVTGVAPAFLERYADRLDDDVVALVERFMPRVGRYLLDRPAPWTLLHGDFRLDNLLFGGDRVVVLDWQTISLGTALSDVAYFVGASLLPPQRREHERTLVEDYRRRLGAEGIVLDATACWDDYRRHSFSGLVMAIIASMLVARTPRSDDMFMAMAQRHGRQALDLGAESLLGGAR